MVSERERLSHWGRHVARSTRPRPVGGRGHLGPGVDRSADLRVRDRDGRRPPGAGPDLHDDAVHGAGGLGDGDGSLSFTDPMVSLANALHRRDPVDLLDVDCGRDTELPPAGGPRRARRRTPGATVASTWPRPCLRRSRSRLRSASLEQLPTQGGSMTIELLPDVPRATACGCRSRTTSSALTIFGFPGEFAFVPRDETVTSRTEGSVSPRGRATWRTSSPRRRPRPQLENASPPPADIMDQFGTVPAGVPARRRGVRPPDHRRSDERLCPGARPAELLPRPQQLPLRPECRRTATATTPCPRSCSGAGATASTSRPRWR